MPEQERAEYSTIDFKASERLKALGICWNTLTYCFLFSVPAIVLTANDPEKK